MKYSKPQLLHFLLLGELAAKCELPHTGQYLNLSIRFIFLFLKNINPCFINPNCWGLSVQYYEKMLTFAETVVLKIKKNSFFMIKIISKSVKKIALTTVIASLFMPATAQKKFDMTLWPNRPTVESNNPEDTAKIWVFLPKKEEATGRAVVICPGGGYQHLAMNHEGFDWAPFFNNMGIAAIVLKYRMPHGNFEVPVSDAEEAVRVARRHAAEWNLKSNQIGIMGSSAGGHLASTIATHAKGDALPDFQILFYPVITMMPDITHKGSHDNFLGEKPKKKDEKEYSNDQQVSRVTPPAFIALSDDDHVVLPANGVNYYIELYRHDVPATLHVYPHGGHGWGNRDSFKYHNEMQLELKAWLRSF